MRVYYIHEQWMCLGMQRHTHITLCNPYFYTYGNNLIPISDRLQLTKTCPDTKFHVYIGTTVVELCEEEEEEEEENMDKICYI